MDAQDYRLVAAYSGRTVMTMKPFAVRNRHVLLAAVGALVGGSLVAGGPAIAQTTVSEITVMAPHAVRQGEMSVSGEPVEIVTLVRHVGYGDLDLTKSADLETFKTRIKETAKQACAQLDTLFPDGTHVANLGGSLTNAECVKAATDGGMAQVDAVMAIAAGKK
jgi:UrcA family protein